MVCRKVSLVERLFGRVLHQQFHFNQYSGQGLIQRVEIGTCQYSGQGLIQRVEIGTCQYSGQGLIQRGHANTVVRD